MSRRNNSIRKQMNSNPFMDERSVKAGESAENSFPKAAKVQASLSAARRDARSDVAEIASEVAAAAWTG